MSNDVRKYPADLDDFADVYAVINDFIASNVENVAPFLTKSAQIVSVGSCFASNISKALVAEGYSSFCAELPEMANTTFATRALVEVACSANPSPKSVSIANATLRDINVDEMRERYRQADVYILTIGVAWITHDLNSNEFVLPLPQQKFGMRLSSVQENAQNVERIIQLFLGLNPNATVVLTVSPVPLVRGFPGAAKSPFVADCVSKSIMSLTAFEICKHFNGKVIYWPSFEMVRWLGAHLPPVFGQSDGHARHPNDDLVAMITRAFISKFSES